MPNFDERLRRALGRMAAPGDGDPEGRLGDVRSRKHRRAVVRRLQVAALTVAVVAGTVGGTLALAHAFGGTHRTLPPVDVPTVTPTVPVVEPTSTESPTPTPTPIPSPSPSDLPGSPCSRSMVEGTFDAVNARPGTLDRAFVFYPPPPAGDVPNCPEEPGQQSWGIEVRWGSGAVGSWALPQCSSACAALAVGDVDGNGSQEVALQIDAGASTGTLELLQLLESEAGPNVYQVAGPGATDNVAKLPLKLTFGGSVTHQDFISCDTSVAGKPLLYETSGTLDAPGYSYWTVVETTYELDGSAATATVTGVQTSTLHADTQNPSSPPFPVRGQACFDGSNLGAP